MKIRIFHKNPVKSFLLLFYFFFNFLLCSYAVFSLRNYCRYVGVTSKFNAALILAITVYQPNLGHFFGIRKWLTKSLPTATVRRWIKILMRFYIKLQLDKV